MGLPAAPTGVTNTRLSDSQAKIAWTNNATGPNPYTSISIQVQVYTGSTFGPWTDLYTIPGPFTSTSSFTSGGNMPNAAYNYRVRANNSSGSSAWATGFEIFNTPGAPAGVTAAYTIGTSVQVTWTNTHYVNSAITLEVQRSNNGGAFTNIVTGLSYTTTAYTDASPPSGTNQYRVRAVRSGLDSAYTNSNTVTAPVIPQAPTLLSPNGVSVDFASPVTLTWTHNPSTDGAPQSHFTIRYSTDGGSTWTAAATNVASSVSSWTTTPGSIFFNGTSYLWEVQTQGSTAVGFGPYSSPAAMTGDAIPVATFIAGHPDAVTTTVPLDTQWIYNQDQGLLQAGWSATLSDSLGNILETQSGTGTGTVITWHYPILTGQTYTVSLTVQSTSGQQSVPITTSTLVTLEPPAAVTTIATFQSCTGTVELDLTAAAPVSGTTLPVDHVVIQRRINGGDWVTTLTNVAMPVTGTATVTVLDTTPITHGTNEYRVISVSALPSYYINPIVAAEGTDGTDLDQGHWIFLNYGPGFGSVLRMHGDPMVNTTTTLNISNEQILGKAFPVALIGKQQSKVYAISGSVAYEDDCVAPTPDDCTLDSAPSDFEDAAFYQGIIMHRDYKGRRVFGTLSAMATSDGLPMGNSHSIFPHRRNIASVGYTVTTVDYNENVPSSDVSSSGAF